MRAFSGEEGERTMDMERLGDKERYDMLAQMADMYYNQGKTQSEIARHFGTNRFRVAKLIQDAREQQIVEIRINYSNERNQMLEEELKKAFGLKDAVVVNTRYSSYIDGLTQIGEVGAAYLARLLASGGVLGVTWGKTLQSVISRLPGMHYSPVTVVQLTGYYQLNNPSADTRELVRTAAASSRGEYFYLDAPMYVSDPALKELLCKEPVIRQALSHTKKLDVVASGIGGDSSLPLKNPLVRPYITEADMEKAHSCIGSLYGRVLDENGNEADLSLNRRVVAGELSDILAAPSRIVVGCGRHKVRVLNQAARSGWYNILVTDADTAVHMMENWEK